jgi:hypothetical protein
MSDGYKGFVVTLDRDCKDEDADRIGRAISMIKGIVSVAPSIANPDDYMNRARVKWELRERLIELLRMDEDFLGGKG